MYYLQTLRMLEPGQTFLNRRTNRPYTVRTVYRPDEQLAGYGVEAEAWCRIDRGSYLPPFHRWVLCRRLEDPALFTC